MHPHSYLHHVFLRSSQPDRLAKYYADVMDMRASQHPDGGWLCEGPARQIGIVSGKDQTLAYAGFACASTDDLDRIRELATSAKVAIEASPSPLFAEGAFSVVDPCGNRIVFGMAKRRESDGGRLRGPLQHLTLVTKDKIEQVEEFYGKKLGMNISDRVMQDGQLMTSFMRSNHEHHTLACFRGDHDGIDHHSYEAGEWDMIRDWADRFASLGVPLMWGPGRHGPGNNLFIFVKDPDGNWIEVSAELEVVHDRETKVWPHGPRTLNLWGDAIMRI